MEKWRNGEPVNPPLHALGPMLTAPCLLSPFILVPTNADGTSLVYPCCFGEEGGGGAVCGGGGGGGGDDDDDDDDEDLCIVLYAEYGVVRPYVRSLGMLALGQCFILALRH
ncbi:hypothetical protein SODALDRAFT_65332 [Sodiomyces alkalinus F11]|uniref:Uncharacterized protein n=1 Tax=Sodiomyces alkalinus (strain CBS 110278 / VKM F-3762 / F11) TaxID=1314773 RepID=A0A3N2PLK4_SODAK|nr:hypothetical protein SODALDRAFT_65332 [Sodiomyces alkalinus F11]ROT35403.1 hypothetical protein SODALDRAFT_65332 [Sodiomyces alkalinus F11]